MTKRPVLRCLNLLGIFLLVSLAACSPSSPTGSPIPTTLATPSTISAGIPTITPDLGTDEAVPSKSLLPTRTSQAACPPPQNGAVDPAAILELGPGPGIPPSTAAGEKLVFIGTVLAQDCTPLAGAAINVWQTDANGEYGPGHGSNDMRCCYVMGSLQTDALGRYQLITVKPATYLGEQNPPPAHIHVEIEHPQTGLFATENVFAGDPYLPPTLQGYVLVTLETISGSDGEEDHLYGTANIMR